MALKNVLAGSYAVASLDFQALSHADLADEAAFVRAFCRALLRAHGALPLDVAARMRKIVQDRQVALVFDDLFDCVDDWCEQSKRPVVLVCALAT